MDYENDPGWQFLKQDRAKMMADQSKKYDSKKNVWVPDPDDAYIAAEIKSTKGDTVVVVTEKGEEKTVKKDEAQQQNPPKFEKAEDMSNLSFLNDASVLHNLRQRYFVMMIYTYSGLFVVVINPYKRLPIYTDSVVAMYMGKRKTEMPPHLFAAADGAYRNVLQNHENQSMLITGESGAGKTENTKKVISYFAVVGATKTDAGDGKKKEPGLEEKIVQTNPVLEAFGNAKTVRNNNSSRFGKFIRTHFNAQGRLAGGDIEHYLLEKSRVCKQAPGERCYHIFYQLMSGQIKDLKKKLLLSDNIRDYIFVSQAEITIDGMDDSEEMRLTDEAFDIMGFTAEEKFQLFSLTAAIMHMGNMKFKQRPREEQAEADDVTDVEYASKLFDINAEDFVKAMLKPRVKVGAEWVSKGQNLEQVNWAIGAMAKAIYARMFDWIIKRCNQTLISGNLERKYFIGVLDIAGFEIFDLNSFEQLWINFVNERLQQFFNHHMFVLEQEEYKREGIQWVFIDFGLDLASCIELIEKPMGVISMLDEECIVPKASELAYAQKMNDQHLGKHPSFQKPKPPKGKQAEAHFALVHYAGTVRYNVLGWLEKNKDPLNDTAIGVLKSTKTNHLLLNIWSDYKTQEEMSKEGGGGGKKKGKSASMMTVSMLYRESLNKLINMLNTTFPHFIRCIIPNEMKKAGMIDAGLVLNQLTCNGVLEGIRICRKGFPNRLAYPDFRHRYAILAPVEASSDKDPIVASQKMSQTIVATGGLKEEEFRLGTTKIFFKAGILAKLEDLRDVTLSTIITKLQAHISWFLAQIETKRREKRKLVVVVLQRNIRSWCALRTWEWFKLYGKVKPMLKQGKVAEEMEALEAKLKETEEAMKKIEEAKVALEAENKKILAEKLELELKMQNEMGNVSESEERFSKLNAVKIQMEGQMHDLNEKIAEQEQQTANVQKSKKKVEQDLEAAKKSLQEAENLHRKQDADKQGKELQIRSLQDELTQQDGLVGKLNKEKKHMEEVQRKLTEDLQVEEDKVNHLNKNKVKLEQALDEMEDNLEREKRSRQDLEKSKRKIEGELKLAQENLEEFNKQTHDMEGNVKKKELELMALGTRLEDEQTLVSKLQKQAKDVTLRIQELEEELESERQARNKAEKSRAELQRELEELGERLDEAGGASQAQGEVNKKREAEMSKLRRDLEEANVNHESQLAALRKKHNDAVMEMGNQLDQLQKSRLKIDKEKGSLNREIEELNAALDSENKGKVNAERQSKQLEAQLADCQARLEDLNRQLADHTQLKNRLQTENADLMKQLEGAESQANALARIKQQMTTQLNEAKLNADEDSKQRQNFASQLRGLQGECVSLREMLEEEGEAKSELQRLLSKASAEAQQWRAKYESEGLGKSEEFEDQKRKWTARIQELQESVENANQRTQAAEKARSRLQAELEDAQVDAERSNSAASANEKKLKNVDKIIDEWKRKSDDLAAELDASQRDSRNLSTEMFKLRSDAEQAQEQIEGVRRENKMLAQEIKDITSQLGEGGKSVHELQKSKRRLEMEKEELQTALEEAETTLEGEESKVLRLQVEVSQIRQEIDKRIHEKEEEFENTRKNHQRAIESMQASLEAETKGRAELMKLRKKLEADINDLEIALDHANNANAEAQKIIKRYLEQIHELQVYGLLGQIDEEQRTNADLREQLQNAERRCSTLQTEREEVNLNFEVAEKARRQLEEGSAELKEQLVDMQQQFSSISLAKRKLENEIQALKAEYDEALSGMKALENAAKQSAMDAAKLAEELRQEQEHYAHGERIRRSLEQNVKELQGRLDDAETTALKGSKKIMQKLESKIRELEAEFDSESRRYQEADKNCKKAERRVKEVMFQLEEDKKSQERLHDVVEKQHAKLKTYKRQLEEAEQVASVNLAKFRQLQHAYEEAEERAETAENSLAKMRARSRGTSAAPSAGLPHSASRSRMAANHPE